MSQVILPIELAADHPAYAGHFPGRPLLPGALLLAEVMEAVLLDQACAAALGSTPRLGTAKFLSPVSPGDALTVGFELGGSTLRFAVHHAGRVVASGHFERADRAPPSHPSPPLPAA